MRWIVLAIFAYLVIGLQEGTHRLLEISFGTPVSAAPQLLLILAVFIAAWAPSLAAGWAMILLGILADLAPMRVIPGPALIGPASLAFVAAASVVIRLRALFRRDSPLGLAVLVLLAGVAQHLVYVLIISLRSGFYGPIPNWSIADQLYHRFWELLYTTFFTLPFSWLLLKSLPLWAFEGVKPGPYGWR